MIRKTMEAPLRSRDEGGEGPIPPRSIGEALIAALGLPCMAKRTGAAETGRALHHDPIPHFPSLNLGPHLGYDPAEFMPQGHRGLSLGIKIMINMDIRPANTRSADFHHHFPLVQVGRKDLNNFDMANSALEFSQRFHETKKASSELRIEQPLPGKKN
jgi:hypothetical protein